MKKSLLALAVLGAFAGVASAQSSVNLYGTLDLSLKSVKNDGSSRRNSLSQNGINASQLGFKGTEDIGGGLKAGFVLLSGVNADTGTANSQFFNRRSTVSLMGNFGEVRLGRDYTPTYGNRTNFDAFGDNGVGASTAVAQLKAGTFTRVDNAVSYILPSNIGGAYGQVTVGASEGAATNPGRYLGTRVGFASGPFDVALGVAQQRFDSGAKPLRTVNLGGSYDFGLAKVLGYYDRDSQDVSGGSKKDTRFSLSTIVPVGQGEIHLGYNRSKLADSAAGTNSTVKQMSAGYVYKLSKRTALYGTYSRLSNDDTTSPTLSVASGSAISAAPKIIDGGKSAGIEFGLRHFF